MPAVVLGAIAAVRRVPGPVPWVLMVAFLVVRFSGALFGHHDVSQGDDYGEIGKAVFFVEFVVFGVVIGAVQTVRLLTRKT